MNARIKMCFALPIKTWIHSKVHHRPCTPFSVQLSPKTFAQPQMMEKSGLTRIVVEFSSSKKICAKTNAKAMFMHVNAFQKTN
jgi:hypothetical protein